MPEASLTIGPSDRPTQVRLRARPGLEDALRQLSLRFPNTERLSPRAVEIPLDDLMTHVAGLQSWPEPDSVTWDDRVARLVTDSLHDARSIAQQLASDETSPPQVAEEIFSRLWKADLTDFQRNDIAKLLSLRHGANFSVPGAGKTRVALAVFHALREQGEVERLLIVGPKSSYDAWTAENRECFVQPLRLEVMAQAPNAAADAVIVNYERLASAVPALTRWLDERPALMILDEAHRMKLGGDGVYGSACLALGPFSKRRLILTGTPAPNGVKDLENLFSFVWPGTGRQRVVQAVGGGNLSVASQKLRPLFARTTKKQLGLPPVTPIVRRVDMPPLHKEVYAALVGEFSSRAIGARDDLKALGKVLVYLMMAATSPALLAIGTTRYEPLAYQVAPLDVPAGTTLSGLLAQLPRHELSPKYEQVLRIVRDNAATGRKTLVWSTFIRSLTTLRELLAPYQPAMVHGGTDDRDGEIRRFREDPDCLVLLSNPATLGEGISLHHECHDAVYVDRDFAAGRFVQSVDRIHRLGLASDTETRVTILVANETVDEVVEQRLGVKLNFMSRVLDDPSLQELADLDEEPLVGGGLDRTDLVSLLGHLNAHPA